MVAGLWDRKLTHVTRIPGWVRLNLLSSRQTNWNMREQPGREIAARSGDLTCFDKWVRVKVRRPVPTATTPDTMVALTNPFLLT
jgi:hypothetical protein